MTTEIVPATPEQIRDLTGLAVPAQFKVRCHYCSRFFLPQDINWTMKVGGAYRCRYCSEKYFDALSALMTGRFPANCQACNVAFVDLADAASGDTRVSVVWKDQTVQVLCSPCADSYERKRLDLYGDTIYGQKKKLKGAK